MAVLRVYEWEDGNWPEYQAVRLNRQEQARILQGLARHYHVPPVRVVQSHRRGAGKGLGGAYTPAATIRLGQMALLSTVIHEFTHHLCWTRGERDSWHGRRFRTRLAQVYRWAARYLPGQ
jgi:predicted SprT family Zn-dependent metalloprotease